MFIDGQLVEELLPVPQPFKLFADKQERDKMDKMDKIKFSVSDSSSCKGSEFLGFAFKTGQLLEVKRAYRKIKAMHPSTDHIIAACNLRNQSCFQGDGEVGAGYHLLKNVLQASRPMNTAVFVVHYKNGENIGNLRFEMIEHAAEQATSRLHK